MTRYALTLFALGLAACTGNPGAPAPGDGPAPLLAMIAPQVGSVDGGTTVTATGTNFDSGATVRFGDTPAQAVTVSSSTSLTAITPAHDVGKVDVVVANPNGTASTLKGGFEYLILGSPAPAQSGPNEIRLYFNWRLVYLEGDADDYWIYIIKPSGTERRREDDDFNIPVTDPNGSGWILRFEYEGSGIPAAVKSISMSDPNMFVVTVAGEGSSPKDMTVRLERF